jgi:hypothetical protein
MGFLYSHTVICIAVLYGCSRLGFHWGGGNNDAVHVWGFTTIAYW